MRILVTGATGQLGSELNSLLLSGKSPLGNLPDCYRNSESVFLSHSQFDITSNDSVSSFFKKEHFDLVINCAAYTNVDKCEKEEALSIKSNGIGPWLLAQAVEKQHGKFVQVSTDYVFPGTCEIPRSEDDAICPVSAYGRSKYVGEVLTLNACKSSFVVRTAWLYGCHGHNFVRTIIKIAKEKGKLAVVSDQFGNPTNAADVAYEILLIAATNNYGIYHCTNEGTASWYDFAKEIVENQGIECECEAISSVEYKRRFPGSASRPHFSALENRRLKETIGNRMRPWKEALKDFLSNTSSIDA